MKFKKESFVEQWVSIGSLELLNLISRRVLSPTQALSRNESIWKFSKRTMNQSCSIQNHVNWAQSQLFQNACNLKFNEKWPKTILRFDIQSFSILSSPWEINGAEKSFLLKQNGALTKHLKCEQRKSSGSYKDPIIRYVTSHTIINRLFVWNFSGCTQC